MSSSSLSSSSSGCPPFEFHDCGRRAIGYDQGPLNGTNYPLVEPSDDIRYLLADGYLAYEDLEQEFETPYRIVYMFGFGCLTSSPPIFAPTPTHAQDVLIFDKNDDVVFDSSIATYFTVADWCDRMKIYEWRTDEAVCRLVVHTKWPTGGDIFPEPRNYDEHLAPDSAVLSLRVVEKVPKRVLSLVSGVTSMSMSNIDMLAGFNVQIEHIGTDATDGGRHRERIRISAEAGSGLGRFPACDELDIVIRRINGVKPKEVGDFFMSATGCYYVRQPADTFPGPPPFAVPTPATLKIGNDCLPCCECEDYVEVFRNLCRIYTDWEDLGGRSEVVRDQYAVNRERWLENLACRRERPLDLQVQSDCPCVSFGIAFCPRDDECNGPLELTVGVTSSFGGVDANLCNSFRSGNQGSGIREPYTPGGLYPTYTFFWDGVQAGRSAQANATFCFDVASVGGPTDPENNTFTLTLSGTLAGEPILNQGSTTLSKSIICAGAAECFDSDT